MELEHIRWDLDEQPNSDGTLVIVEGDDDQSVIAVVSASMGEDPNKRFPSFAYARLMTGAPRLAAAAQRVLAHLNQRIDAAPLDAKPVFNGIVELHDALHAMLSSGAPSEPDLQGE